MYIKNIIFSGGIELIGSSEINKDIRKILSPALKDCGFSKINTRKNWRWNKECVWVLQINALGKYFSDVTGWTPMSVTATVGIYYEFVPPENDEIKVNTNSKILPDYHQCHLWKELTCNIDQANYINHLDNPMERKRNDIWWVEIDGSNGSKVITDIKDSFINAGLPWLEKFTNLDIAFEEIEKENDSFNKFYKAKYFAERLNNVNKFNEYANLFKKESKRISEFY